MTAAFYFLVVVLGIRFGLSILLRRAPARARWLFEVPEFRFSALVDGLLRVLFRTGHGPLKKPLSVSMPQWAFSL